MLVSSNLIVKKVYVKVIASGSIKPIFASEIAETTPAAVITAMSFKCHNHNTGFAFRLSG